MKKVGILGGGQLGRMLIQAGANYPVEIHVMEKQADAPAAALCRHFTAGDITDYESVLRFGKGLDVLTIEIEQVNVDALETLEKQGVTVIPAPSALRIIQSKIAQKQFFLRHEIPSSPFQVTSSAADTALLSHLLPAVHKRDTGGYDGRGVTLLRHTEDLSQAFDVPSVLEQAVDIRKEIAMIVAVPLHGSICLYPPVEMVFDPDYHQLSHQLCPAEIAQDVLWKAEAIALQSVRALGSPGLFAVEMFVDRNDNVLINEIAPRVHNSGHHTIEGHYCSQFDMLWRILLDYPTGDPSMIMPSVMVNLVGHADHSGPARYEGLDEILRMENAFVHIYGKPETRPGRKMGHVTIISRERQDLLHKANRVRQTVRITSPSSTS